MEILNKNGAFGLTNSTVPLGQHDAVVMFL